MKFKTAIAAAFAVALSYVHAFGQASILPPPETCFQATTGINGMVGVLGTITGGSLYTNGTYGGVSLTGGSGSNATANITVSGGIVTAVAVLNPGVNYVVGDTLSASAASIGGTGSGFSVPVNSIAINSAVAGGTIGFYIPSTLTPKQTWQNAGETVLNANPVGLDSNGCAIIYGAGTYRAILKDSLGNTVYDQLTAATNGANGIFWASLASGTGNAITVTDTAFSLQDGYNLQFLAKIANTGPTTISVSGGSPIAIVNDLSTGPAALSGGEIGPGNTPMLTYDATNVEFHIVNPAAAGSSAGTSSSNPTPQGYLNLVGQASGNVVQGASDVIGATTVFYSPFVGSQIQVWNGGSFTTLHFTELTLTLNASGSPLNSIQDVCVFSNNGVPTLVAGPTWTSSTAGSGNRGTGAGTAQIVRLTGNGLWANAVSMIGYNGLSSFTIPADQCTYVGSIAIDGTAGQVSAYRTYGQSRKFGVWNAYNRQPIYLKAGDPGATWTYNSNVIRPSNGNTANSLTIFSGLAEENYTLFFNQFISGLGVSSTATIGIGYNSTTAQSGQQSRQATGSGGTLSSSTSGGATYLAAPAIGINVITALEQGNSNVVTFSGQELSMLLSALWRG